MGEVCVINPTTSLSRHLTSNNEGGQQWQLTQTHNNQIEKRAGGRQHDERGRMDDVRQGGKGADDSKAIRRRTTQQEEGGGGQDAGQLGGGWHNEHHRTKKGWK